MYGVFVKEVECEEEGREKETMSKVRKRSEQDFRKKKKSPITELRLQTLLMQIWL